MEIMRGFIEKLYFVFISVLLLVPALGYAQVSGGFLSDNIWYSKDPFFAGDSIRIYSGIFNSSDLDISGRVEFADNGELVSASDFNVEAGGNLTRVWADWQAKAGEHKISASIVQVQITTPGREGEKIDLTNTQTQADIRQIDLDTDKDSAGDEQDDDDDADGVPDKIETQIGTDPKDPEPKELFNDILKSQPEGDFDSDGIDNQDEVSAGTNPYQATNVEEYIEARQKPKDEDKEDLFEKTIKLFPQSIEKPAINADNAIERQFAQYIEALESKKQEIKGYVARSERGINLPQDEEVPFKNNRFLQNIYVYFLTAISYALKIRLLMYIAIIFLVYKLIKLYINKRRS